VVVVTINYRLGHLGFFAHPALEGKKAVVHNFALLDQIAALNGCGTTLRPLAAIPLDNPVWRICRRAERAVAAGLSAGSGIVP
jgi:hypothetical protein